MPFSAYPDFSKLSFCYIVFISEAPHMANLLLSTHI